MKRGKTKRNKSKADIHLIRRQTWYVGIKVMSSKQQRNSDKSILYKRRVVNEMEGLITGAL